MFQHRERGLNQAYQLAASALISLLFWGYYFFLEYAIPQFELAGVAFYFEYYLAILLAFQVSSLNLLQQNIFAVTSGILESHRVVWPHVIFGGAITCIFLVLTKDTAMSRLFLFTYLPLSYLGLVVFTRYLAFPLLQKLVRRENQPMVLIGSPADIPKVESLLAKARKFGIRVAGILTEEDQSPEGIEKLGAPHDLERVLDELAIGNVFITSCPKERHNLAKWMRIAESRGCRVSMVNDLDVFLQRRLSYFRCDDVDLVELREEPLLNAVNRLCKRSFDIVFSLPIVIFILPPLMLGVWLLQRWQAPGPLFFRQLRSGLDNRPFEIFKFRTMYAELCNSARQASQGDERVFPAGRWLRRFSLDEFPQFWNVLCGHMSVVGPRPHMQQHDKIFAQMMSNYRLRAFVKPGLSGLAQIRGYRGETLTAEDVRHRVECDIEYIETWSLGLDIRVIWQTIRQLINPPVRAY